MSSEPHTPPADEHDYRTYLYQRYVSAGSTGPQRVTLQDFAAAVPWFHGQIGRLLPSDRDATILDIGCGSGRLMWYLREQGYRNVSGIDVSPEQVAIARSLAIDSVEQADADSYLQAHPETFDLIILFDVLEHVQKNLVVSLLQSIKNSLKRDGRIIVHTVNGASPFFGLNLYGDFTHSTAFSAGSLRQLLSASGFGDVSLYEVQPVPHGPVSLVRKIAWLGVRSLLVGYLAIETGVLRGHILTQNLLVTARRSR